MNSKVLITKNGRTMSLWKYAIWGNKKSRFLKEQESQGFLSSLGIKTALSKIPLF